MMNIKTLIYFSLLSLHYQNALAGWPQVPEPPQSKLSKLADEVYVNGVPMSITHFNSYLSSRQVLSYYRTRWSDNFAESDSKQWQQISQFKNEYLITVQVQDNSSNGSHGRINISKVSRQKQKKLGKGVPMMADSIVLNEVITKDKLNTSTMLLLINKSSVEENVGFYKTYFDENDWRKIIDKNTLKQGAALVYKNETDELSVTVKKINGMSSVVLNKVVKRGWFN